jgi:hypothetical protein
VENLGSNQDLGDQKRKVYSLAYRKSLITEEIPSISGLLPRKP